MTSSIVKTVIFTILVPGTVAVIVPRAIGTDASAPNLYSSIGFLPMALGVAIYLWCAWDFATAGQGRPAAIVFVFFNLFVMLYEEPALKRKFGASYEDYLSRVPRWIPRLPA